MFLNNLNNLLDYVYNPYFTKDMIKSHIEDKPMIEISAKEESGIRELEETLKNAFIKAFELVFNKGTEIIEKSFDKEKPLFELFLEDEFLSFENELDFSNNNYTINWQVYSNGNKFISMREFPKNVKCCAFNDSSSGNDFLTNTPTLTINHAIGITNNCTHKPLYVFLKVTFKFTPL